MSSVLGKIKAPFSFRGSPCPNRKIEKFDTKTNFYKKKNPLLMFRNGRSIE
jgi:hypothetical protein